MSEEKTREELEKELMDQLMNGGDWSLQEITTPGVVTRITPDSTEEKEKK